MTIDTSLNKDSAVTFSAADVTWCLQSAAALQPGLELQTNHQQSCTITEKAPTRARNQEKAIVGLLRNCTTLPMVRLQL